MQKIEQLKQRLHLIGAPAQSQHITFMENDGRDDSSDNSGIDNSVESDASYHETNSERKTILDTKPALEPDLQAKLDK